VHTLISSDGALMLYFETASSSARAWSISSYAYATTAAGPLAADVPRRQGLARRQVRALLDDRPDFASTKYPPIDPDAPCPF
jgi:hypothetical protein